MSVLLETQTWLPGYGSIRIRSGHIGTQLMFDEQSYMFDGIEEWTEEHQDSAVVLLKEEQGMNPGDVIFFRKVLSGRHRMVAWVSIGKPGCPEIKEYLADIGLQKIPHREVA